MKDGGTSQRAMSKVANLTSRQADKAVRDYLRRQPYSDEGLKRVPCRRCGKPSEHQWNLRPCALGKRVWYGLCADHDLELNRVVVEFLRVPGGERLLAEYLERHPRQNEAKT